MSQIEELQSRITAAMERISAGIENLAAQPAVPDGEEDPNLAAALEEEKIANAQLQERVKTLKAKHAEEIEALMGASRSEGDGADIEALQTELEQLRSQVDDSSEADGLKAELAEATAKLMAAEAARTELAEAKAALEANDQSTLLQAEVDALKAQLDAVEDAEPYKVELEEMRAQMEDQAGNTEEVDGLHTEIAALKAELANTEHLEDLKSELDMLRAERVSHGESMVRLDGDLQRLRKSNELLREANAALREANEAGVGDPSLINKAMLAELEGLRAARATDAAEVHAVLTKLEPLLAQADLAEGEDE